MISGSKFDFGRSVQALTLVFSLLALLELVVFLFPARVTIIFSKSVKYDWFAFWSEDVSKLSLGDYVLVRWDGADPQGEALRPGMILLKRLFCLPGQHLQSGAQAVSCDGIPGDQAQPFDSRGRRLRPFPYDGIVPSGKLYLVGDAWNSYDSRYWGFVGTNQVMGKVIWGF